MSEIIVFGDSVTKGVIYDPVTKAYSQLKEGFLSQAQQILGQVKNFSVFGATIHKGVKMLERFKNNVKAGDTVILEFGGNDCNFDWSQVADDPSNPHDPNTKLEEFKLTYKQMIRELKALGARVILLTPPPLQAERFFQFVTKNLNQQNVLQWLGDVSHIYRWQEMYALAAFDVAQEEHTEIIDLRSEFLKADNLADLLCEDGMHPSEKGHELMARTLVNRFSRR